MSDRLRITAFLSAILALACLACSPVESGDGEPRRWARRFVPFEETWRPESEIPAEPQESPAMVLWELSLDPPDVIPTPGQRVAADRLVAECHRAALEHGWYDFRKGLADGYTLMFRDRRHYENREYMLDDRVLDPDRPEFLMYYGTPRGKELTGFMFYSETPPAGGPRSGATSRSGTITSGRRGCVFSRA